MVRPIDERCGLLDDRGARFATIRPVNRLALLLVPLVALVGCASVPPPTELRVATVKVIGEAEEAGAKDDPEAKLRLKNARELLESAEKGIEVEEHEFATRLLNKSMADAELSRGLARRARTQKELDEAEAKLKKLKTGGMP